MVVDRCPARRAEPAVAVPRDLLPAQRTPLPDEFGHLLDYFGQGDGVGVGLPPGLRRNEKELYTADAHTHFRQGKQIELDRYMRCCEGHWQAGDAIPIGHPYVFKNDSEFLAGYLEMFFRNPHYFAAQNEALYQAFAACLKQDPRRYWREDFPYYTHQNREHYLKQRPPKPCITLPA